MKDDWWGNKQHGIPEKWPLHTQKKLRQMVLRNQVFCLLLRRQGSSTMKGIPDSCVVHFEWHDFEGQLLSFLQKKWCVGLEVHKEKVWKTDSRRWRTLKKSQFCSLTLFLSKYLVLVSVLEFFPLLFKVLKQGDLQLISSFCFLSLWITSVQYITSDPSNHLQTKLSKLRKNCQWPWFYVKEWTTVSHTLPAISCYHLL